MTELSPFDFFRQETSNIDVEIRSEAMKKVAIIAAIMGPEKARNDMLPYLQSIDKITCIYSINYYSIVYYIYITFILFYIKIAKSEEMDQVLLALSEKLGKFLPLIGGSDHSHTLIPLFETLCEIEEVCVRDMIVASICMILKQLGPSHKTPIQCYFEFFKRLSNEEAGELFYARVSCCYLVPDLYKLLNDTDRILLREIFTRLCKDELPIVRRAAALQFMKLSEYMDIEALIGEYLVLFNTLINDESQTIQVIALENLGAFAKVLKTSNQINSISAEILPHIKNFTDSQSWKMRQAISRNYGTLSKLFTPAEVASDVFPCLMNLIQDPEPEVRSIAMLEVFPFLEVIGTTSFITEFAPVAQQLIQDPIANVRKILADLSVDVASKVGPVAVSQHFSELIIKLLEDEDPQVRLCIIKKLPIIAEETPSLCTRITEMLKTLFIHSYWRVRMELVITMPSILKHMGQDYYIDHFLSCTLLLLKDQVDKVRTVTSSYIPLIGAEANSNWVYEALFPSIKSMSTGDFTIRTSMISALEGFLRIEKLSDKFHLEVINLLVTTSTDKVPNIRIRAAQGLNVAISISYIEKTYGDQYIRPALNNLLKDKDKDVKYFASKNVHE